MADLGTWLTGGYSVPAGPVEPDDTTDDPESR
jgi:endogenous inhibitor of DNA gyrase (YacG/DUF329 family)